MEGKKVYELLPCIDWDKGKAALWLLGNLNLEHGKESARFTSEMTAPTRMPFAHSNSAASEHSGQQRTRRATAANYSLKRSFQK